MIVIFVDFAIIDDKLIPPVNFSDVFCRSPSFPGVSGQELTLFLFLFLWIPDGEAGDDDPKGDYTENNQKKIISHGDCILSPEKQM